MFLDSLKEYNVILASKSPRRSALLKELGVEFTVAENYPVDETYPSNMRVLDVPAYLAELKSAAYPVTLTEKDILMTADTLVFFNNEIMGKPKDRDDAIQMLSKLSGNRHEVLTAVCLRSADKMRTFEISTYVTFRALKKREIEFYVDNYKPYDKAGAYAIQEWIGYIGIESIEGSYYNVVGLPTQKVFSELKQFIEY